MAVTVQYQKLYSDVTLPQRQTEGSAGYDIYSYLSQPLEVKPMQRFAIPTGLKFEIPHGYLISVRPRSGLSLKEGLTLVNSPGTIDCDFHGEVKILMINLSDEIKVIQHQQRIAQLIIEVSLAINFTPCTKINLSNSIRGENGIGSTGNT